MKINIQDYVNQKDSLRALPDEQFEKIVKSLARSLERYGFEKFVRDNMTHESDAMMKDWLSLQKWKSKHATNISATCTTGMKILKTYMPHFYNVQNHKGVSVSSLWNDTHIEKALRFNRKYHSTPYASELIRSLSFTNGLGKITMYRPVMAKLITNYFNATSVLDVCSGWGGRMIGCCSIKDVKYTGFEPCINTFQGLHKIKDLMCLENATLINKPAEEAVLLLKEDDMFDIGLTSPPYYDLEIYSDEDTQSLSKYPTYNDWVEKFLCVIIKGVLKHVRISCWSVKNFKTNKKYNLFDDVVRIHDENGWTLQKDIQFTMKNSKRPGNVKNDQNNSDVKTSEECTYVFVKKS